MNVGENMKKRVLLGMVVVLVAGGVATMLKPEQAPTVTILVNGITAAGNALRMVAFQEVVRMDAQGMAQLGAG